MTYNYSSQISVEPLPLKADKVLQTVGPAMAWNWPVGLSTYAAPQYPLFPASAVGATVTDIIIRTPGDIPGYIVTPLVDVVTSEKERGVPIALHFVRMSNAERKKRGYARSPEVFWLCLASPDQAKLDSYISIMTAAIRAVR